MPPPAAKLPPRYLQAVESAVQENGKCKKADKYREFRLSLQQKKIGREFSQGAVISKLLRSELKSKNEVGLNVPSFLEKYLQNRKKMLIFVMAE